MEPKETIDLLPYRATLERQGFERSKGYDIIGRNGRTEWWEHPETGRAACVVIHYGNRGDFWVIMTEATP